ncbi:MAG: hypothetical protein Q7T74_07165 [Candidatus Saccharibacteria bacterium]|nr:hypothetical protein [Candidatus Saccharibacteria bacterium]
MTIQTIQLAFFIFLIISSVEVLAKTEAGLCKPEETSVFSCQTKSKKWINLCQSPDSGLQYRFGTQKHIELLYPDNPESGSSQFKFAHYSRYQAEKYEITFSNQGTDYTIFDYAESSHHRAGVRIGNDTEILCVGKIKADFTKLQMLLSCDSDNALNGENCSK